MAWKACFKFEIKVVKKKAANDFENVFFWGVMGFEIAASAFVHDALKQGAENGRWNQAPIEDAAIQKQLAHGRIEIGKPECLPEKQADDIGKKWKRLKRLMRFPYGEFPDKKIPINQHFLWHVRWSY